MPVHKCQINGKPGHKWGQSGKCYTGPDSEKKARQQGVAEIISGYKMASEKVSFDYDGVLSKATYKLKAKELMKNGTHVFIISARNDKANLTNLAKSIGIPESRIYTTGSNKAKIEKIIELGIGTHYDNNPDVIKALENTGTTGIKV